jgi:hypothetical protein
MPKPASSVQLEKHVVGITPRSPAGGFSKARGSAPLQLHLKAIKRDGFLKRRA